MRAFVVGNGVSLTPEQLTAIRDEVSFATNRIAGMFDKTDWRPSYFVAVSNTLTWALWNRDAVAVMESGIPTFASNRLFAYLPWTERTMWIECIHHASAPLPPPISEWSKAFEGGVSQFGGSGTSMIHIADILGYSPIYLLGFDGNWKLPENGRDPNHWSKDYMLEVPGEQDHVNFWNVICQVAAEWIMAATKAKVVNLSPGTVIRAFPKGQLEAVV